MLTSFGADILGIWSNRILESSQWPSLVPDWDIHPCFQVQLHWWNNTDLIVFLSQSIVGLTAKKITGFQYSCVLNLQIHEKNYGIDLILDLAMGWLIDYMWGDKALKPIFYLDLNPFFRFFLMLINCNASLCLCENTARRWYNFHQEEGQEVQLLFCLFFCISSWKCSSIWHYVSYLLVGCHLPGL